ncbi:hypothetical protein BDZ89DRAFT_1077639 [Hymenopellis radicata]|nr:hypothetical protein BDZ89DRAFT_1077639 [Hymenopellis radicata]
MARSTRSTHLPIEASPEMETEALQNSTNARPKRRGRPPKGALAAKLKARAKAASPLPPSSPTASSNWAEPDSIPIATSDDPPLPTFEPPFLDEQAMLRQDFESCAGSDDAPVGPDADISTASDPFGFFRVERTLKRDRGTSDVPAYPTPEADGGSLSTPSTPRRRRSSSRGGGAASRNQFSMPSSPSPIKPSHRRKPTDPESESSDRSPERQTSPDGLVESDAEHDSPPPKAQAKGKQRAAKRSLNTEQIQKEWEAVLPKRTRGTRKQKATVESESEDEEEAPTRKKARRKANTKTQRAKKRDKDDVDTETDEKFVKEREDRIAFFKKLQAYEISKENVFIV